MSTQFTNRQWRLPNNENKDKQSNYSMSFNGGSEKITFSTITLATNYTLSAWAKRINTSRNEFLFGNSQTFGYGAYFNGTSNLYFKENQSPPMTYDNAAIQTALARTDWVHWLFIKDATAGTVSIYVDGVLAQSVSGSGMQTINAIGGSGSSSGTQYIWNGKIDAVSIFDYALTDGTGGTVNQIAALYGSSSTGIGNPMSLSPKPVAYYPLGDQDAFNGADYLVPNSSLKDYVFDFNGSSDFMTIQNVGNIFSEITKFSFSGWFKIQSYTSGSQNLIIIANGSTKYFQVSLYYVHKQIRFIVDTGFGYFNNLQNIAPENTWFHYAGVFDGAESTNANKAKLYINGNPVTLTFVADFPNSFATIPSTAEIQISKDFSPFSSITGEISNLQFWNTNLSLTEVETLYNNGSPIQTLANIPQNSNLQGWWKLDASATYDGSNWTIEDSSTNSNTGTSSGMTQANLVQSDLSFTSGYSPYALDFDSASSDYIQTTGNTIMNGGTEASLSVWINTQDKTQTQQILSIFSGKKYVEMTLISGGLYCWLGDGSTTTNYNIVNSTNLNIDNDTWYNLTYVFDGSESTDGTRLKVYKNGSLLTWSTTRTIPTTLANDLSLDFYIGARNGATTFNGSLSNPSLWNASLTPAQVSEIYNEGVPSNLNNHSAYSNLVSWWQLGSNTSWVDPYWIVLDEKGTNNGQSQNVAAPNNMGENAIVDGVGSYANGLSSGMGGDEVVGDAPYSTANALSVNMDVEDRVTGISNATITTGGTGYATGTNIATTGGTGSGCTVDITASGAITAVTINNSGLGYSVGEVLTVVQSGGSSGTITVTSLNTPS
jgi:hypothetical protein